MPSSKERDRARARAMLEAETPRPLDECTLLKVEEEAAVVLREAKGAFSNEPTAINDVNRSFYQYLLRRRCGVPSSSTGGVT